MKMLVAPNSSAMEGGAFVVLRLVRLTRIFRLFKNPKLVEPVAVIGQTMSESSKPLYVFASQFLLGVLISGSLMYLVEKGEWQWQTRTYLRPAQISQMWNHTSQQWYDVKEESPFKSIPVAFWWALTTITTVGYGEVYPTTDAGKLIAAVTMVFSMVVLALPVGVIGGNFTKAWHRYEVERIRQAKEVEHDKKFITEAIQKIDPYQMSHLMLVEVWHERFPTEKGCKTPREGVLVKPDQAEFLGEVDITLELPMDRTVSKTQTLKLKANPITDVPKRTIHGYITVQYTWTPLSAADSSFERAESSDDSGALKKTQSWIYPQLQGSLKVTLVSAEGLSSLSWLKNNKNKNNRPLSNPYCTVYCYPTSPALGDTLYPTAWRSPSEINTITPAWHCSHTFEFRWQCPKLNAGGCYRQDISFVSCFDRSESSNSQEDQIINMLHSVSNEIRKVRSEIGSLSDRVDEAHPGAKPVVLPNAWSDRYVKADSNNLQRTLLPPMLRA